MLPVPILTGTSELVPWIKKLTLNADPLPPQQHRPHFRPISTLFITPLHTVFPHALKPWPVSRLLRVLLLSEVTSSFALPKQSPHAADLQPFPNGNLKAPR